MKGDRVEIVIDAGGSSRSYEIEATRAGRRVDITHGRGVVEVTEVPTRRLRSSSPSVGPPRSSPRP